MLFQDRTFLNLNFYTMKKVRYLLLAMTLCSITTVSAERMSLCQTFVKLGEQCDDFSAWKGSEISGSYGSFSSSLEVEGAMTSCIRELIGNRSFEANFGSFDSEDKAVEKVESLKKEMLTCYPFLKFADTKSTFSESLSYVVHHADVSFRFYKACFKIAKYGQSWDVTFEFPQTKKKTFSTSMVKPYTDYKRIEGVADQNNFSQGVRWLLEDARKGFATVKGEKMDNRAISNEYKVTYMPAGRKDCYIEDRGLGIIYYEIPILQNVTMETLQITAGVVVKNIQQTFGPEYGFSASADGMSVTFVHADRPYNVAGILYIEKIMDGYNMNLSLKAEPKPVM